MVRDVDTVARAGGDEFAIVLYDAQGEDDVLATMQRIQAALGAPFCVDGHEVHVECSLGASVFPRDGADAQSLLKNADAAMYHAKDRGRNGCRFYTAQMNASVATRLDTVQGLRRALQHRHFELHYQPSSLRSSSMPIGEWVLDAACAQNAKWREQGHAIVVAVNLSAGQLHHEGLADAVRHALARHGLAADGLELELTESTLMKNVADAAATLHALSALGVRLALDDFGTGYSSLSYLKRFPVHKLKIDQSFVRDISRDVDDAAIVTAVIAMAKSLGLRVIAEGIETREQLDFLRGHGCDELQGHLLGRALPAELFGGLLAAQRSGKAAF